MVNIPLFVGFYTSQVVQDFFHQQYHLDPPISFTWTWFVHLHLDSHIPFIFGIRHWKQHKTSGNSTTFICFFWFHHRLQVTWSLRLDPSRYPFQYLGDSPCLRRTDFSLTLWRSTWVLVGGRPVKCVKCNATKVHEFTIQQWYDTHLLFVLGADWRWALWNSIVLGLNQWDWL